MKHKFWIVSFLFLLSIHFWGCTPPRYVPPKVGLQLIASGFTSPVALVAPGDVSQHLFIVDQIGVIWIISEGQRIDEPFLDLRAKVVELNSFYDERGLLA